MRPVKSYELKLSHTTTINTINTPATNKETLAKELQKSVSFADVITQTSACMIDAMAFVQRLIGDQKTFAEVAESLLCLELHEGSNSKRIDVILTYTRNTPSGMQKERIGELNLEMNLETFYPNTRCSSGENSF